MVRRRRPAHEIIAVLFAIAMVAAAFGIVLYNIGASGLAAALLILSFAGPASATK